MKPMIYIAGPEEKVKAKKVCKEVITLIDNTAGKDLGLKCFIMQALLEGFEEAYNVDIKNGVSIKDGP